MHRKPFDIDAESAALTQDAISRLDAMVSGIATGKGVELPRRGGGVFLLTKSAPGDDEEAGERALFRITSVNDDGEPLGHSVVTKDSYRAFRRDTSVDGRLRDVFNEVRNSIRPDICQGFAGIMLDEPTLFEYQLLYRDHAIATSPLEGLVSADGRKLVYSRPLSSEELKAFEIRPIGARPAPPLRQPAVAAPVQGIPPPCGMEV